MILDLERFLRREEPYWRELESLLDGFAQRPGRGISLPEAENLRSLYQRAAADLSRLQQGAAAPALTAYLETLVARAYGETYQSRPVPNWRLALRRLPGLFLRFPIVFRRRFAFFALALAITCGGALFGALAVSADPGAVAVLLPAGYLRNPLRRVHAAESGRAPAPAAGEEAEFSAELMTHNIDVALLALFLGLTLGVGTAVMLFSNGVMLGAVVARYAAAGVGEFAGGWLLPHGVFEIPAVLIAGQAGFMLAAALLRGSAVPRWRRLRAILPEVLILTGGFCAMLVWAGTVEGMFSQHHAPQISYAVKIAFGLVELAALALYLGLVGRSRPEAAA